MGYPPLPAQSSHFCQYAAFLARTLKATSIPNYLNIIGILHKEFNRPNPLLENSPVQSLNRLSGIKRVKGMYAPLPKNNPLPPAFWVIFTRTSTCALVLMPPSRLYVW